MLNLDQKPLDNSRVRTLITDITDSGQVFTALSSYMGLHEFDPSLTPQKVDAVVHFAAIPRIMIVPDNELFRINTMGTYNVIEAAVTLGIRKIVIASSETTYGVIFANEPREPEYFPLDEDYDVDPMDSYALSKVVNEKTARAFALRSGFDIYALRIGNVIEPHEYEKLVPQWKADPAFRKKIAWSYIDARDLGEITRLCIEKDGLGYEVFNAANDDTSSASADQGIVEAFLSERPGEGGARRSTRRCSRTARFATCSASRRSTRGGAQQLRAEAQVSDTLLGWEPIIRLVAFAGVLAAMALWELYAPRREQAIGRGTRWPGNLGVVVVDTLLVRLVFPTAAVGVAIVADDVAGDFSMHSKRRIGWRSRSPLSCSTSRSISSTCFFTPCRSCGGCTACTTPTSSSTSPPACAFIRSRFSCRWSSSSPSSPRSARPRSLC